MAVEPAAPFLDPSPPPWAARGLAWILIVLFTAIAVAVIVIDVPETVAVRFVLMPVRGTDPVRTLHDGIVIGVHVSDAATVEQGHRLFTIGSLVAGDRAAEREALETSLSGGRDRLANERERYDQQRQADEQELRRLEQRVAALETQAELRERQAVLAREVAARQQRSYEEGLTSWLEASQPRLEADRLEAEVEQVRADAADAGAAAQRLRFEMAAAKVAFDEAARSVEEDLARSRVRKGMLDREPARDGHDVIVTAPCTGTVVRLAVRAPGTAVDALDVLAEIACADERLQAELIVPQRGLGRIDTGQIVKLRYDAFPYQRYGVRYGTLRWISPALAASSDEGGTYRALVDLDDQAIRLGDGLRPLRAGMTGDASVVVGRRSLVSYAFEPLRAVREGMSTDRPAPRP